MVVDKKRRCKRVMQVRCGGKKDVCENIHEAVAC